MSSNAPNAVISVVIVVIVIFMVVLGIKSTFCAGYNLSRYCPSCCRRRDEDEDDEPDADDSEVDPNRYQRPPDYAECVNNPRYPKPTREQSQVYTITDDRTAQTAVNRSEGSAHHGASNSCVSRHVPVQRHARGTKAERLCEELDIEGLPSYTCVEKGDFVLLTELTWQQIRQLQEQRENSGPQGMDNNGNDSIVDIDHSMMNATPSPAVPQGSSTRFAVPQDSSTRQDGGFINRSFVMDDDDIHSGGSAVCSAASPAREPTSVFMDDITTSSNSPVHPVPKPRRQKRSSRPRGERGELDDDNARNTNPLGATEPQTRGKYVTAHALQRAQNQAIARAQSLPLLVFSPQGRISSEKQSCPAEGGVQTNSNLVRRDFHRSLSDNTSTHSHCSQNYVTTIPAPSYARPQLTRRSNSIESAV